MDQKLSATPNSPVSSEQIAEQTIEPEDSSRSGLDASTATGPCFHCGEPGDIDFDLNKHTACESCSTLILGMAEAAWDDDPDATWQSIIDDLVDRFYRFPACDLCHRLSKPGATRPLRVGEACRGGCCPESLPKLLVCT